MSCLVGEQAAWHGRKAHTGGLVAFSGALNDCCSSVVGNATWKCNHGRSYHCAPSGTAVPKACHVAHHSVGSFPWMALAMIDWVLVSAASRGRGVGGGMRRWRHVMGTSQRRGMAKGEEMLGGGCVAPGGGLAASGWSDDLTVADGSHDRQETILVQPCNFMGGVWAIRACLGHCQPALASAAD